MDLLFEGRGTSFSHVASRVDWISLKPLASGCVNLYVEQEVERRARNKQNLIGSALMALDAELVLLKKLLMD